MERRVLVTGASSGIGLATARHLAELGFVVLGLVPTDEQRGALAGVAERTLVVDLGDPDARRGALEGLELFALVNNAGYLNAGQVLDVPLENARRQLETMVLAPVELARQALPPMLKRGQGRIVNVTSAASHSATPLSGWYQASKAALRELNDALRLELIDTGVEVIDVEPGGTDTGIWARAARELRARRQASARPDRYDAVLRHLGPAKAAMAPPEHVARAIGALLTVGRPPAHRRVGPDATVLRALSEVTPPGIEAWLARRLGSR